MTQKTKKASILAFTLIMLGILLAAGLSLMGATLVDQRTAIDSGKAIQSLQTAESGTDIAVSRISNDPTSDLATIFPASLGYTWSGDTVTASAAQGEFTLTFLDKDGNELSSSSAKGSEVESIKSIGTYAGINRAIEVALAAGCEGENCNILDSGNSTCSVADIASEMGGGDNFFFTAGYCSGSSNREIMLKVNTGWVQNNASISTTTSGQYGGGTNENGYVKMVCIGSGQASNFNANTTLCPGSPSVAGNKMYYVTRLLDQNCSLIIECSGGWSLHGPGYL